MASSSNTSVQLETTVAVFRQVSSSIRGLMEKYISQERLLQGVAKEVTSIQSTLPDLKSDMEELLEKVREAETRSSQKLNELFASSAEMNKWRSHTDMSLHSRLDYMENRIEQLGAMCNLSKNSASGDMLSHDNEDSIAESTHADPEKLGSPTMPVPEGPALFVPHEPFQPGDRIGAREQRDAGEQGDSAALDNATQSYVTTFSFRATCWDVAIVGFTDLLRPKISIYLSLLAVANVMIQVYLCAILQESEEFQYRRQFDAAKPAMEKWRVADGHQAYNLGTDDVSLTARVCNQDDSLSVATVQSEILHEINGYLSLELLQLDRDSFSHGPVLCMLCVGMFALIILSEMRRASLFMVSVAILPRSGRTQLSKAGIVSISWGRLACCWSLCLIRLVIASILLYSGVRWLSSTSSIQDLMLNAAALGFVLEIDEMLFATLIPEYAVQLVERLEALTLPKGQLYIDGLLPNIILIVGLVLTYTQLITPGMDDMIALKREMCGGQLDFVIRDRVDTNLVFSRTTNAFQPSSYTDSLPERAVSELKIRMPTPWVNVKDAQSTDEFAQMSLYFGNIKHAFDTWVNYEVGTFAENINFDCVDWDENVAGTHAYFNAVRETYYKSRDAEYLGPLPDGPFLCSDYFPYCFLDFAYTLRFVCPKTCGCDDFKSGLYMPATIKGCPSSCATIANQKLDSLDCMDVNLTSSNEKASWDRYWASFASLEQQSFPSSWGSYEEAFVENMTKYGCGDAFALGGFMQTYWTPCSLTDNMKAWGKVSIMGFCPVTCCKSGTLRRNCPASCKTRGG